MIIPKKRKIAKEWTAYDLGLPFVSNKPKLKRKIKKYSSKKVRRFLKKVYQWGYTSLTKPKKQAVNKV